MCRNLQEGGRRCPCLTDPAKIAERNARRRANYIPKKTKGGLLGKIGDLAKTLRKTTEEEHSIFGMKAPKNQTVFSRTDQGDVSPLGVSSRTCVGYLVDTGYYSEKQISGLIDYTKLNDKSYEEFGFSDPRLMHIDKADLEVTKRISRHELSNLSYSEKKALQVYTGDAYGWINSSMFPTGKTRMFKKDPKEYEPMLKEGKEVFEDSPYVYAPKNPEFLKEFDGYVTSAMPKAPLQQRLVYRGMSSWHGAFSKSDGTKATLKEYVDKNFSLGQEVVFDGYQSTSTSVDVAQNYTSHDDGLLFEIKTSSGLNVTSVSQFDREQEVILPRGSRYMVVGLHEKVDYSAKQEDSSLIKTRRNITVVQLVEVTEDGYIADETHYTSAPPLTPHQLRTH